MAYINNKTFEIVENVIEIDDFIVKTISILNKKGYKTLFCCSGHYDKSIHLTKKKSINNIKDLEICYHDIIEEKEYYKIYFRDPYSKIYIWFDSNCIFPNVPKGFNKEITENGFIEISKLISLYDIKSKQIRKEEDVIAEIKYNDDILYEWAKKLPSIKEVVYEEKNKF